jgi:hypothetical protein
MELVWKNEFCLQDDNSKLFLGLCNKAYSYTRVVWKVRGLAAMRRCYAEGCDDCYAKL